MSAEAPISFAPEPLPVAEDAPPWTVLVVDDDASVHEVTRIALADFEFEGRALRFLNAFSAAQAEALLTEHQDTALVLLDVVMESDHAGLGLVSYVREVLGNHNVRIVLRTGQPGQAPERRVISDYDISDYKTKVELTAGKLYTAVLTALRTFSRLSELDDHRRVAEATARALRRFFPAELLRLLDRPALVDVELGDQQELEMTVVFADIRDFTARAESLSPAACFDFVNRVFVAICPEIRAHGGVIDKFLGDGFLALFPGSADDAARAAVAIQRRIATLELGGPPLRLGIGMHTGRVMIGTVGEPERMEATVLSDDVNLAARVEALTKAFGANVLLSEQTLAHLDRARWATRYIGVVEIAGKRSPTTVYELLDADPAQVRASKEATQASFQEGLVRLAAGEYSRACVRFDQVLAEDPDDEAARLFLRRAAEALLAAVYGRRPS
ncbi:MAG: adenylate/guanylate cyclase domain-containing protein [Nannocystaceae bacterium]